MNEPDQATALGFRVARLHAVERAQGRYIYLYVLAGVFYLALDAQLSQIGYKPTDDIALPFFTTVKLSTKMLWALAPIVLSVLLSAVVGSMMATTDAGEEVKAAAGIKSESSLPIELDPHPTIIDFVAYTRDTSPKWVTIPLYFSYPAVLIPVYLLAVWLWWKMLDLELVQEWYLVASGLVLLTPLPRFLPFVWKRTPLLPGFAKWVWESTPFSTRESSPNDPP